MTRNTSMVMLVPTGVESTTRSVTPYLESADASAPTSPPGRFGPSARNLMEAKT
eukprot:CAMPEP_0181259860 /NCGR_PEP_ID=MMETSP1097-20121128/638_1 /TAXON_ID=35684 /ORGANISM="Pseudopedinella elastica, Strain CCMP716" /LENGTH=53 /DNA_ID=CAMNT_0023358341 /DNA_START=293 /DNA_END=454 /DNA_ORIENTATION=-